MHSRKRGLFGIFSAIDRWAEEGLEPGPEVRLSEADAAFPLSLRLSGSAAADHAFLVGDADGFGKIRITLEEADDFMRRISVVIALDGRRDDFRLADRNVRLRRRGAHVTLKLLTWWFLGEHHKLSSQHLAAAIDDYWRLRGVDAHRSSAR